MRKHRDSTSRHIVNSPINTSDVEFLTLCAKRMQVIVKQRLRIVIRQRTRANGQCNSLSSILRCASLIITVGSLQTALFCRHRWPAKQCRHPCRIALHERHFRDSGYCVRCIPACVRGVCLSCCRLSVARDQGERYYLAD